MNPNLSLEMDFDLESFDVAEKEQKSLALKARAVSTRSRIHARRAKSETILAEILPARITPDESWHVLSSGDIDGLSYLAHLLKTDPMRYVALSTWCMAMEDVRQIAAWIEEGKIGRLDAYVGEIFPGQYAEAHAELVTVCRNCGGRVAIFRNHSKLFLCEPWAGGGACDRIQRQYQHQPAHRKHLHHGLARIVRASQSLFRRNQEFQPGFRRLDAVFMLNSPRASVKLLSHG
jgi:hypothetical protein